ncbi:MAG: flagellar motor switch protein FliN [Planctomycetaceae bacterium]
MSVSEASSSASDQGGSQAEVHPVEFPHLTERPVSAARVPLQRFYDVSVDVSVELGRVTIPIGDLLKLGEGAVLELERALSEPVDIVAQGVRLARGEVVVVEDRYAVRITEIENSETSQNGQGSGRN